jgi:hypothetical protein
MSLYRQHLNLVFWFVTAQRYRNGNALEFAHLEAMQRIK